MWSSRHGDRTATHPHGHPHERLAVLLSSGRPQAGPGLAQLWGQRVAEVAGPQDRPDLDLPLLVRQGARAALDPLDDVVLGVDLEDRPAGHLLLGLRERPVDHGAVAAREPHARPKPRSPLRLTAGRGFDIVAELCAPRFGTPDPSRWVT